MSEANVEAGAAYDRAEDRSRLVGAILPHVPFDRWSDAAFKAGAKDAGIPLARALNAFPGGMAEVLVYNHALGDAAMLDGLAGQNIAGLRVRERIAKAVRLRLEAAEPHKEAIRAGLSFLLLPGNAGLGPKLLYRTVDAIWYAIGDQSTDFSFYSKRALLAAIYSATLLYWLEDKSPGHAASWAFLDRRIGDVMRLGPLVQRAKASVRNLSDALKLRPGSFDPRMILARPQTPGRRRRRSSARG